MFYCGKYKQHQTDRYTHTHRLQGLHLILHIHTQDKNCVGNLADILFVDSVDNFQA